MEIKDVQILLAIISEHKETIIAAIIFVLALLSVIFTIISNIFIRSAATKNINTKKK